MIKTFEKQLLSEDLNTLKPFERVDIPDGGVALPDEVQQVVANRSGSILSASTILKSDFFSNLQKMSLPEWVLNCSVVLPRVIDTHYLRRIDGAPNFRRVPLSLRLVSTPISSPGANGADRFDFVAGDNNKYVCGRCVNPSWRPMKIDVDAQELQWYADCGRVWTTLRYARKQ